MKNLYHIDKCPHCDYTLDDGLILDVFKKFRNNGFAMYANTSDKDLEKMVLDFYGSLNKRFSKIVQVHDNHRVYYECPNCKNKIDKPYK